MKRFVVTATVLALSAVGASAADLPARVYTKPPATIDAAYDWSGFYAGVNVGYGFGRTRLDSTATGVGFPPFVAANTNPIDGVVGGGQIGWNAQLNHLVVGIEADFQGTGQRMSSTTATPFFATSGPLVAIGTQNETRDERLDWFGTVRGRVGYAADGLLWYGTGGLAYGHIKFTGSDSFPFTVINFGSAAASGGFDASKNKIGWSLGGGVEGAIARSNWTWKLEYLHLDFGHLDYSFVATDPNGISFPVSGRARMTDDIVRVGLNYRINGPVAARY